MIPEYAGSLDGVTTSGKCRIFGSAKGVSDDTHIPAFDVEIMADNASFKYADLPKTVEDIVLHTKIQNPSGLIEDTFFEMEQLHFTVDGDEFGASAMVTDLMGNTKVDMGAHGKVNLGNLAKAYPIPDTKELVRLLQMDLDAKFDMESVSNHAYDKTEILGTFKLNDFHYQSTLLKSPLNLDYTKLTFSPAKIALNGMEGKIGESDFNLSGKLENLLGYVFKDEVIQGDFNLTSSNVNVNDLMMLETEGEIAETETEVEDLGTHERILVPDFLDASFQLAIQDLSYDNLKLKEVKGLLKIKDQKATLENLQSNLLGGVVKMNGEVSTADPITTFAGGIDLNQFKISETFKSIDLFKQLAPLAEAMTGDMNAKLNLKGNLKDDMLPNIATFSGDALAKLVSASWKTNQSPLIGNLNSQFDFVDLSDLSLKDLTTNFEFKEGNVDVKPFELKYKDIPIAIAGSHNGDMELDYKATLDVPAKYLGAEVNKLLQDIGGDEAKDLTVPVTLDITGPYKSPSLKNNLQSGVKNLTAQLVDLKKKQLLNKGKGESH